jgi:hypothetical protein
MSTTPRTLALTADDAAIDRLMPGTLPLRPFGHTMAGRIESDGQECFVTALVAKPDGDLLLLSAVGAAVSLGAVFGKLVKKDVSLPWQPAAGYGRHVPRTLRKGKGRSYERLQGRIPDPDDRQRMLREQHMLLYANQLDLEEHLLNPRFPKPPMRSVDGTEHPPVYGLPPVILANHDEPTPSPRTWLGHLRALGVGFDPAWAAPLWQSALDYTLATPLPAVGLQAWELQPDPALWDSWLQRFAREQLRHLHVLSA